MAVDVVDGLEMVEVEQEQRDLTFFGGGARDHPLPRHEQRAAIEEARQRVGVGKVSRALFGLGAFDDFAVGLLFAAPAEEAQRQIANQRSAERRVGKEWGSTG